ncbi:MAG: LPS assembly lipoprotein LptE, partial [Nitrospirae bacterium]|nr:LPS assembly lipoprotein LptE [Nitrospirota bacterium]
QFTVEGPGPSIGGSSSPSPVEAPIRLAVRDFLNRTFQGDLEFTYTAYVKQEFATRSGATIQSDEAKADFLLKGEIVSVKIDSLAFSTDRTRESRVTVAVRITVEERKTGKIVWGQTATGSAAYLEDRAPDPDTGQDPIQFNQVLQDRAFEQAGLKIAQSLAAKFGIAREHGVFIPSATQATGKIQRPDPKSQEAARLLLMSPPSLPFQPFALD